MSALAGPAYTRDPLIVRPDGYIVDHKGSRVRVYRPEEAIAEIEQLTLPGGNTAVHEVVFYPGATGWVNVGAEIASILPPLAQPAD